MNSKFKIILVFLVSFVVLGFSAFNFILNKNVVNSGEVEISSNELYNKYVIQNDFVILSYLTDSFTKITDKFRVYSAIEEIARIENSNGELKNNLSDFPKAKVLAKVKEMYPSSSINDITEDLYKVGAYSYNFDTSAYMGYGAGYVGVIAENYLDKTVETKDNYEITFYRIQGTLGKNNKEDDYYDYAAVYTKEYYELIALGNTEENILETKTFEVNLNEDYYGNGASESFIKSTIEANKDKLPKIKYTISKATKELIKIELVK